MTSILKITATELPESFENEIEKSLDDTVTIRSNLKNMEDINKWIQEFAQKTNTQWNTRTSNPNCERLICSKQFVCHHSSHRKVGRKMSRYSVSKNADCRAFVKIMIKKDTRYARCKDKFVKNGLQGRIEIFCKHSHNLNAADTLRFLSADPALKDQFFDYFCSGMGIAEAARYHSQLIELENECVEEILASGRKNPTERCIRYWHDMWLNVQFGARSGAGLIEKLKEKQAAYQQRGITIMFSEDPFAVAVVTPLMRRAHELESSKEIAFVDTTSACDAENHAITFMLTACAAGAVPLGILITKGQTMQAYIEAFKLLQEAVPDGFSGNTYPAIFLTDQSQAEINAIRYVWPKSQNLLCIFHVAQAVWRWLWESSHNIPKEQRPFLMRSFQRIMYARTKQEAADEFQKFYAASSLFENWQKYLLDYWQIREQWCLAWRDEKCRGHHTNNFSEVAVRIFKDIVLTRVKAYNVITLVNFICTVLENYYCHRLRKFANNRMPSARYLFESMWKKTQYLQEGDVKMKGDYEYIVPGEQNGEYMVNLQIGVCSCPSGMFGSFCKHQCAVYRFFEKASRNFPPLSVTDRYKIAKLALGDAVPGIEFYSSFLSEEQEIIVPNSSLNEVLAEHETNSMSCENDIPVQQEGLTLLRREKLNIIHELINQNDEAFGSSLSGLNNFIMKLKAVKSVGRWETFLHTAGSKLSMRWRDSAA